QCQVVASPACVARLEVVAVAGEDRAVGEVTERAGNRIGRCVVNHSENCAHRQRAAASIDKSKRHVAVNGHAEGGNFRRFDSTPVQHALVGRERIAPELLPVPTVTAPLILPVPPSVPTLTCTAPLPVPEPVLFLTRSVPLVMVVPPV